MSKRKFDHAARAKELRKFGFKVKFTGKGKNNTGAQKAAVRRVWAKVHQYATPGFKQEFVFIHVPSKATLRKVVISPKVVTPGGFFYRRPKGAKKFYMRVKENGELIVRATGKRGGGRREVIRRLDPEVLAEDVGEAVDKLKPPGKPNAARVIVGGHDGNVEMDMQQFDSYMEEFLEQMMDPNREAHPVYIGKGKGGRIAHDSWWLGDESAVAENIAAKFYFQEKSKHGQKRKLSKKVRRR